MKTHKNIIIHPKTKTQRTFITFMTQWSFNHRIATQIPERVYKELF